MRKKRVKASMTIEAALATPIFLFFVVAMMYFLLIISLQSDIQLAMEETARSLGKHAYLAGRIDEIGGADKVEDVDGDTAGILTAGINAMTLKAWMLKDGLAERIDNSHIRGGTGGFYVYHSSFDEEDGILDIVVNYTYVIPYLPESIGKIRFVQRCRSHVWTGSELKKSSKDGDGDKEGTTVYVTPYGSVYHTTTQCHYLDLSIHQVSADEVAALRNADGGIYYMCPDCCKSGEQYGTVYTTDYGTKWHSSVTCSALKRTVKSIDLSEVGDLKACPKCGGNH